MAMPAIDRARAIPAATLTAVLFAGGALNGFAARILESWRLHGGSELLLGISPFELIVVWIALDLVLRDRAQAAPLTGWAECLLLAGLMLPSSTASWAALACYAGHTAWRNGGATRLGALLIVGLSATALWSAVFVSWLAHAITSAEATLVAGLLAPVRPDIFHVGNIVGVADGHQVVLIIACTTANALPRVLLAIAAIAILIGGVRQSRLLAPMALVGIAFALANWCRLAAMAWSAESYALVHGPIGGNLYDLGQSLLVLAAGTWMGRR